MSNLDDDQISLLGGFSLFDDDPNIYHNENNHSDNQNNGLITKIWGRPGWTFLHSVAYGYPIKPTEENKIKYKNFFVSLGDVLPCKYCRESYTKFITTENTALTDNDLVSRRTFTDWFYRVHNAVNKKLGVDYGVSLKDVDERYESFRAVCGPSDKKVSGCIAPLNHKAFSFKKLNQLDCPIVSFAKAGPFIKLAKIRGLNKEYFIFLQIAKECNGDFNTMKKLGCWCTRNQFCQKQIQYMRESAIPSVEESGPWEGTPTLEELKLLLFLCSNLNNDQIKSAYDSLIQNPIYLKSSRKTELSSEKDNFE